jgi:hypothetical protein
MARRAVGNTYHPEAEKREDETMPQHQAMLSA